MSATRARRNRRSPTLKGWEAACADARPVPVVRWLRMFCAAGSLRSAMRHEMGLCRTQSQVAAEPLWGGRSRLASRDRIGLLVDQAQSRLVAVFSSDCWSESVGGDLALMAVGRMQVWSAGWRAVAAVGAARQSPDREYSRYGEVFVASPTYCAVVCRADARGGTKIRARALAAEFGLPVRWLGADALTP